MARRLVQIGFGGPVLIPIESVQQALEGIGEWLRISSHAWILFTGATYDEIRATIHSVDKLEDVSMFISDIDMRLANGWLPRELWDWLNARATTRVAR